MDLLKRSADKGQGIWLFRVNTVLQIYQNLPLKRISTEPRPTAESAPALHIMYLHLNIATPFTDNI